MDLTRENYHVLKNERVYLWGALSGKINKLCQEIGFPLNVLGIADNRTGARQPVDSVTADGREIPVVGPEVLERERERYSVVVTCNHYDEIAEQIRDNEKLAAMVNEIYFFKTPAVYYNERYLREYADRPLERILLFRSGLGREMYVPGWDFSDNTRAFFEYLLEHGYNETYQLVWLVKDPEAFSAYAGYRNVKFLSFDWEDTEDQARRDEYYYYLFSAQYIFTSEAYGFAKFTKPDQIRVQFWHGCGYKRMRRVLQCEHSFEYMVTISDVYAKLFMEQFSLRPDQMVITGYPKDDWLFRPYAESVYELLGLRPAKKCIFWMPTFRITVEQVRHLTQYALNPETGLPVVKSKADLDRLNDVLARLDVCLVIKLHHIQDLSAIPQFRFSHIRILPHPEAESRGLVINRLLASADALISDYSSAAVDYLVLNRPIGFTLDDEEDYRETRGFCFDPLEDWLPGMRIYNVEDLCTFVTEVAQGIDSQREIRESLRGKMHRYLDGNSCERALKAFHIEK